MAPPSLLMVMHVSASLTLCLALKEVVVVSSVGPVVKIIGTCILRNKVLLKVIELWAILILEDGILPDSMTQMATNL